MASVNCCLDLNKMNKNEFKMNLNNCKWRIFMWLTLCVLESVITKLRSSEPDKMYLPDEDQAIVFTYLG